MKVVTPVEILRFEILNFFTGITTFIKNPRDVAKIGHKNNVWVSSIAQWMYYIFTGRCWLFALGINILRKFRTNKITTYAHFCYVTILDNPNSFSISNLEGVQFPEYPCIN